MDKCQSREDWELRAAKLQLLHPVWYRDMLTWNWRWIHVMQKPVWWESLGCGHYTHYRLQLLVRCIRQREKEFRSAQRRFKMETQSDG